MTRLDDPVIVSTNSEDPSYNPGGQFDVEQPGIFFNQVVAMGMTGEVSGPKPELNRRVDEWGPKPPYLSEGRLTPLHALSFTTWLGCERDRCPPSPEDSFASSNLVVSPGYSDWDPTEQQLYRGAPEVICDPGPDEPTHIGYVDTFLTSLDSRPGSSGSAVLFSPVTYFEGEGDLRLNAVRYSYGVLQANTETGEEDNFDYTNDGNVFETENGLPTEQNHTKVTAGGRDYQTWGNRGKDFGNGNPFNPEPNQPTSDSDPACLGYDGVTGCRFGSIENNTIWDSNGSYEFLVTADTYSDGKPTFEENEQTDLTNIFCDYRQHEDTGWSSGWRIAAGQAVGFIGTASKLTDEAGTRVASFGVICTPYSSAPWSDNWYHARFGMRRVVAGEDVRTNMLTAGIFRHQLPFLTEYRLAPTEDVYERPMSWKTCPPGSFLKGARVFHQGTELAGIGALLCYNPENKQSFDVPLNSPVQDGIFRVSGMPFSLDQRIGVNFTNSTLGFQTSEITCTDPKDIVTGVQVNRTSNAPLNHFKLVCSAPPY